MRKVHTPKFVDHHPAYSASGYIATNEEPELFNEMLGKKQLGRVATIASSGEVLLSVLLPRATEIMAVDHSYYSLSTSIAKLLLLQKMGSKTLHAALRQEAYESIIAEVNAVWDAMPEPLKTAHKRHLIDTYSWPSVRKEWRDLPVPHITKKVIEKVSFMHGDLLDLQAHGTFDALYVSNAMEHVNRNHRSIGLNDLQVLLNPGGLLLYTVQTTYSRTANFRIPKQDYFELIDHVKGYRSSWFHVIARKK